MMHQEAMDLMTMMLDQIGNRMRGDRVLDVLDVGSLDINGCFRPLVMSKGWRYTGLDVRSGPNVDVVSDDPFRYPFDDGRFDVVISGNTMEHVTAIWRWVPELARVLKPGGWLAICTHWNYPEHRYPVDCWRIMPNGMAYLFDLTGELEEYEIRIADAWDIIGMARKRERSYQASRSAGIEKAVIHTGEKRVRKVG